MYIFLPLLGFLEHFLYIILYCMIDLTGYFYCLSLQNNYGKVRGICPPNNFTVYLSFYLKKCHVFEIWRWNQCIFYILSPKSVVNPQKEYSSRIYLCRQTSVRFWPMYFLVLLVTVHWNDFIAHYILCLHDLQYRLSFLVCKLSLEVRIVAVICVGLVTWSAV